MRPTSAKARSLIALARVVPVPAFVVVPRGATLPELSFDAQAALIVRGCMADEDGPHASAAGRSTTIGPVTRAELPAALAKVFADARTLEAVVQRFVAGPSGVVFSLAPDEAHVEYASAPGDVTSGRVRPFTAVVPCELARYAALARDVAAIHAEFGVCDIEFVGLGCPAFVQVRPVTAEYRYDRELATVAMHMQELEADVWDVGPFCIDLMERPEQDATLIELFVERVRAPDSPLGPGRAPLPLRPFVKVGAQLFADARLAAAVRPGWRAGFDIARRHLALLARLRRLDPLGRGEMPLASELMDAAIALNLVSDVLGLLLPGIVRRLLPARERCRALLARTLPHATLPVDIPCSRRLAAHLERDDDALAWRSLEWADSPGFDVVAGDFSGPRFVYARDLAAVPEGCVLVTAELYPELAEVLGRVAAVIAEGGGSTSHLAILARERRVPLRIQAAGATTAQNTATVDAAGGRSRASR